MFYTFLQIVKRIIFVLSALFLAKYAWMQAMIYVWMSLLTMMYLGYYLPFNSPGQNKIETVYETLCLVIGYLTLTLVAF